MKNRHTAIRFNICRCGEGIQRGDRVLAVDGEDVCHECSTEIEKQGDLAIVRTYMEGL